MARNRKPRRQSAYSSEGYIAQTRSYQTCIAAYEGIDRSVGDAALSAYAALYGEVQRKLFAERVAAGESAVSKKSEYIEKQTGADATRDTGADVQRCGLRWTARCRRCGSRSFCNWIA